MRQIYMIVADVLRALGWEVEINEKDSYWNLVLTDAISSMDMPESHKSCLRGLLRGWLMEFNFEGGRQQVNIYKDLHGLDPEDDRYSCLDTRVNRTDGNTPQSELNDKEIFIRRNDRFDRYVLADPVSENLITKLSTEQEAATRAAINGIRQLIEKKRLVGILRGFDFAKVHRVMERNGAKWLREDGRNEVPSIYDMVVQCEQLLGSLYDSLQKGENCGKGLEIRYGGFCARYSDGRFCLHYEVERSEELIFVVPA